MFVKQILERNPELVQAAFELHTKGRLLPDSYIIDIDAFCANAAAILAEARRHNFQLYFMLKQLGRNPYLAQKLVEMGYPGAVAVDFKETQTMMEHRIPLGNVGHLVQIPEAMLEKVVAYGADVITVYSKEKMASIEKTAEKLGKKQGVLIRVYDKNDMIYSGQTAGIAINQLEETVKYIDSDCPHLQIRGVTSFPCYLYQEERQDIYPTENLTTVLRAKNILEDMGHRDLLINTPSATCVSTIRKMASFGGNCGEPGHGLTGTTPLHAYEMQAEKPAVVYVSEISHNFMGNAYCYGGGHYRRSHVKYALIGDSMEDAKMLKVIPPCDESIDYHFGISKECRVGHTVVMAFRFQIFVTRSDVVLVEGISKGKPSIIGVYDSLGRKKE